MRALRAAMVLAPLLAASWSPPAAQEICFEQPAVLGCPPADLFELVDNIGFSVSASPCQTVTDFPFSGFAISSSLTDPLVNQGPLPGDNRLYLWLVTAPTGYGGTASANMEFSGDLSIVAFEPLTVGADWDGRRAYFIPGCYQGGDINLGALTVSEAVSVGDAVEGTTWGRLKDLYR